MKGSVCRAPSAALRTSWLCPLSGAQGLLLCAQLRAFQRRRVCDGCRNAFFAGVRSPAGYAQACSPCSWLLALQDPSRAAEQDAWGRGGDGSPWGRREYHVPLPSQPLPWPALPTPLPPGRGGSGSLPLRRANRAGAGAGAVWLGLPGQPARSLREGHCRPQ